MNLTGRLDSTDFTTTDDVKALMKTSGTAPSGADTVLGDMITQISRRFVDYLGWHATAASRTEVYKVAQHKRVLSLDAKPIDTGETFTLKWNRTAKDFDSIMAEDTDNYVIHASAGYVHLHFMAPYRPTFFQVEYTGGFGADTAAIKTAFPDLAMACAMQVKYQMDRRLSLGGDVQTVPGVGTTFGGEYALLRDVRDVLNRHRRRPV